MEIFFQQKYLTEKNKNLETLFTKEKLPLRNIHSNFCNNSSNLFTNTYKRTCTQKKNIQFIETSVTSLNKLFMIDEWKYSFTKNIFTEKIKIQKHFSQKKNFHSKEKYFIQISVIIHRNFHKHFTNKICNQQIYFNSFNFL